MANINDISKGSVILFQNQPCSILEFQHVNPGKGSSFVRTRLKNVKTGKVIAFTFKAGETVEFLDAAKKSLQYLYADQNSYTFMEPQNYEQYTLNTTDVGEDAKYLKDGLGVVGTFLDDQLVTITLPKKIPYKVTNAPEATRGDTGGNVSKEITLENGLIVKAPLFIHEGNTVVVNSESGEYVERATE